MSEVSGICGVKNDWSLDITGTLKPEDTAGKVNGAGGAKVNDLGGMIRRRGRLVIKTRISLMHRRLWMLRKTPA